MCTLSAHREGDTTKTTQGHSKHRPVHLVIVEGARSRSHELASWIARRDVEDRAAALDDFEAEPQKAAGRTGERRQRKKREKRDRERGTETGTDTEREREGELESRCVYIYIYIYML